MTSVWWTSPPECSIDVITAAQTAERPDDEGVKLHEAQSHETTAGLSFSQQETEVFTSLFRFLKFMLKFQTSVFILKIFNLK